MAIDFLDSAILDQLIEYRDDVCVSIYLPMTRKGPEVRGNAVQLKNTLNELSETLAERDWRKPEIDTFLEQPRRLLSETEYWQHQHDGLALFIANDFYEIFRLPLDFEPLTVLSERFHVKPLLPFFSNSGLFYILALSQNMVRLFRATRHSIEEVGDEVMEAAEIPRSMEEALEYDDPEERLQHHTTTSGSGGSPEVMHHGHGGIEDEKQQRLRRFLQQVANGLDNLLQDDESPLVLAAVGYVQAAFEDVSQLNNVVISGIEGNPEHKQPEALLKEAREVVAPILSKEQESARTRFDEMAHSEKASDNLQDIVPAAVQGRVDSLFVAVNEHSWGHYDPQTNDIALHEPEHRNGEDLLDFAVVQTLKNGGAVYAVDAGELPGETSIAAVFRY